MAAECLGVPRPQMARKKSRDDAISALKKERKWQSDYFLQQSVIEKQEAELTALI